MANIFVKVLFTSLFYIFSPIVFSFITIVGILRFLVSCIFPLVDSSGLGHVLTPRSSAPGTDKIYQSPLMTLVTISTYEGTIDFSTIQQEFESRVVFARDETGRLLRPELRQYVTKRFGFFFWKNDPKFSIKNHVQLLRPKMTINMSENDRVGYIYPEDVLAASEEMLYGAFVSKRSPWILYVVQNYKDSPDSPISTALVLRIHHVLGDGFSILNLTKDLLNEPVEPIPQKRLPIATKILRAIAFATIAPFQFISETLDAIDEPTWKVPPVKLTKHFNFGVSPMIPLSRIKEVKGICKATFTAVILECFTGALRRFMKEGGHEIPKQIHCITPLPAANHPGRKMRNHMAGCITALPVGLDDPIHRLRKIDKDLTKLRSSTYPMTLFHFVGMIGRLFSFMIKPITINNMTTAIMSNFPGPEKSMGFNQHPLRSMYFSGGLFRGSCAMGFSALSCVGNIRFVFGLDEALVPSSKIPASQLVQYFLEELDILKANVNV